MKHPKNAFFFHGFVTNHIKSYFLAHCTLGNDNSVFLDNVKNKIGAQGHNARTLIDLLKSPNSLLRNRK